MVLISFNPYSKLFLIKAINNVDNITQNKGFITYKYNPLYSYIDPNRENMYYIKYNESLSYQKQLESIINFYASNDESLIYELHAYTGKARIKIYTNESIFNEKNELISFDYNNIA